MITRLRESLGRVKNGWVKKPPANPGLRFNRPLLLFQSDDWGRVGVRDSEGAEELRASGVNLGEKPYDFYSLERAEDLQALSEVLRRYRDSVGRSPSIVMNFILANVDFQTSLGAGDGHISLKPLTEGLPGSWHRPQLFEAYRQGVGERLFFPALHGLSHFCEQAISRELKEDGRRAQLVMTLWQAQTPYIHWRMPWIGYEYWDPEATAHAQFLSLDDQQAAIRRAAEIFQVFFGAGALSACAPGYRANSDTRQSWFEAGVRVAQNGPGGQCAPYLDERGMLLTFRNIEMEPATTKCDIADLMQQVEKCFTTQIPAVVSIHSINFHSTIRDFRTPTLALLDEFLTAVKKKWPNALYVHDADLFNIATEGVYFAGNENVRVTVTAAREGSRA
jgi:hypothetical protein